MENPKVVIDNQKCKLSGECIKACPQKAITIIEGKTTIDYEKCDADGICIPACPEGALQMIENE
jgi:NAD-dependent dihydropyrimidine dehydrogenase PreA subunit